MMTPSFRQLNEGPFAPSELLVLKREPGVDAQVADGIALPPADTRLSTDMPLESILAVAFLANEHVGSIQLKLIRKKVAGLIPATVLIAAPTQVTLRWPQLSLESKVHLFAELSRDGFRSNQVSAIIFDWLGKNCSDPDRAALSLVKAGLASRKLMKKVRRKRLGLFATSQYELTNTTVRLLARQNMEPIYRLLDECQETRPGVWETLLDAIRAGLDQRDTSG